jgi:hypothetical protein
MAVSEITVVRTLSRKSEEDDGDDGDGLHEHLQDVVDGGLDEGRLAEQDLVGLDAARQGRRRCRVPPASICRVSRIVSTPGCFSTDTMTAERPWIACPPRA